uniref:CSON008558 protein n=1 Tax=Culicoides sonorensis TaxID=179676 RepID=A0A336MB04_CULSO
MPEPIVLVISECNQTDSCKIINDIRNCPPEDNVCEINGKTGYKHSISSKYYQTDVVLYPFPASDVLSECNENFLELIEGVLIYFNPSNREFLDKLESYANFIDERGIELGILLCERVFDDSKDGVTYKEAKKFSRLLDLIELNPDNPADGEPQGGYDEVHVALRNTIWSNISMSGDENKSGTVKKSSDLSEKEIEDKLADFEKLLTQAVNFRSNTADLGRNERLLYAQQFADAFESIFGVESDEDGDDDEDASASSYQKFE